MYVRVFRRPTPAYGWTPINRVDNTEKERYKSYHNFSILKNNTCQVHIGSICQINKGNNIVWQNVKLCLNHGSITIIAWALGPHSPEIKALLCLLAR